jgi:hypothetical protein
LAAFMQAVWAADEAAKTDGPVPVNADSPAKTDDPAKTAAPASVPADRVVVMYFHRTQRCPTCLKMGGYSEEAVKTGFAQELKTGKVEFHYIDFQDKKNEALTKGYNVSGPTLIVAKVVDNKVKDRKNLKEMWTKVRDKSAFIEYVQNNVKNCQKPVSAIGL